MATVDPRDRPPREADLRAAAHDLNNLLSVIINSTEFALQDLGEHPSARQVGQARSAAEEAVRLVQGLLPRPQGALPEAGGRHVLVVDDDAGVRDVAARILESHGYQVSAAPDATAADGRLHEADVLLVDLGLPDVSGIGFARRALERRGEIEIVVMSGHTKPPDDLPRGARFVPKPFTRDTLLRAVGGEALR